MTLTVLYGWTRESVAGASVFANLTHGVTDAEGRIRATTIGLCVQVAVTAKGYLDRRTRAGRQTMKHETPTTGPPAPRR